MIVNTLWSDLSLPSVTVTVTETGLSVAASGIPVIAPLLLLILKPAGRSVADHAYGLLPPVTPRSCEYPEPTTPVGSPLPTATISGGDTGTVVVVVDVVEEVLVELVVVGPGLMMTTVRLALAVLKFGSPLPLRVESVTVTVKVYEPSDGLLDDDNTPFDDRSSQVGRFALLQE